MNSKHVYRTLSYIFLIILIIVAYELSHRKRTIPSIEYTNINGNTSESTNSIRCIVYSKERSGRLGNRMFVLASAYGLARLHSCHLYLSNEFMQDLRNVFRLDLRDTLLTLKQFEDYTLEVSNTSQHKSIKQNIDCKYDKKLSRPNAIAKGDIFELTGYWQSYLYFTHYDTDIRQRIFVPLISSMDKIVNFFLNICQRADYPDSPMLSNDFLYLKEYLRNLNLFTWVGIHIRRTDFVSLGFSSTYDYILNAMDYFSSKYPNVYFIVTSDDKSYCHDLTQKRLNVMITPSSFSVTDDFTALILCQHSIVTGGTYGWWAGFLTNGEVTHDLVYPSGCEQREHYYPPWFLLNGNVRAHRFSNYTLK